MRPARELGSSGGPGLRWDLIAALSWLVPVPWLPGPAARRRAGCRGALCRGWRQAGPGLLLRQRSGSLNSTLRLGGAALLVVPMGFTPNAVLHNSIGWWLLWT